VRRVSLRPFGARDLLDGGSDDEGGIRPWQLVFFERGTVHALPDILEEPVVFLSVDTPRREPTDIIFVSPEDGTPATFMARNASP
jgi:hypothetical protein